MTSPGFIQSSAALLKTNKLGAKRGQRWALKNLSMAIEPGQTLALLGPNGSGKSTAIGCIASLIPIAQGSVYFLRESLKRRHFQHIGAAFQNLSLDPLLSGRRNLHMAARLHGISRPERNRRVEELLAFMELKERAHEPVKRYSGGMKRRLDLARALVHNPSLLLLDEPTSGLDPQASERVWKLLNTVQKSRGLTILLATHRDQEAMAAQHLIMLHHGEPIAQGSPASIMQAVRHDVVQVRGPSIDRIAAAVREQFAVETEMHKEALHIKTREGHRLVPALVESFPKGNIQSIAVRKPTLSDAFAYYSNL